MAIFGLIGLMTQFTSAKPASFCVDYSAKPKDSSLLAHELCILDPAAEVDPATFEQGKAAGVRYLGYLSLVEVAPTSSYFSRFESSGIRTLGENSEWSSRLIDLTDPVWRVLFMSMAKEIADHGFDGFFLDTADSLQRLIALHPEKEAEFTTQLVTLVKDLRKFFPESEIIVNRGFDQLDSWREDINGVLIESVFSGYNLQTKEYYDVPEKDMPWLRSQIDRVRAANLDIYILDYVAPEDIYRAREVEAKIRGVGAIPFVSTPDLQGSNTLVTELKRKILVLYGHYPEIEEMPQVSSPLDIATESVVQSTIEWMGFELVYHCIVDGLPTADEMRGFAGIITDDSLRIPMEQELGFAGWLSANVEAGKKLLFLGGYPFDDEYSQIEIFKNLGIRKSVEWNLPVTETEIAIHDSNMMDFETKTLASTRDFRATMSPQGAQIHLRLKDVSDKKNTEGRFFDPVYTCSWGGAILSPYVSFDCSEEAQLFYVNIPRFLSNIWPADHWPVPDVTTRDGLRIFYSHIDGDGFTSASSASSHDTEAICGEVMLEEVLQDLPYPITVSIVEAPLRAHMPFQKEEQIPRYHKIARKIFELPHVEPASHSYSHPYIWDLTNIEAQKELYATLNLPLKLTAAYPDIDLDREIKGSLDFIGNELAPSNKPPAIMLWSGNCRPTPETVAIADRAGVENMNGGDTVICSRYPGLGNVSGKLIAMRGRLQILASNQNEFLYTNGWRGPFHGGFSQVIETFEQTEVPVRLKPVNVYYHFYSADRPSALKALQDIYEWCKKHELHSMTAAEYASMVRDSHYTKIFRIGANRWSMVNSGKLRTMRFANALGYPDIDASKGIVGFRRQEGWTYVHTDGSSKVELALNDRAPAHPYFESADNSVEVVKSTSDEISLTVGDRAAKLTFAQFSADRQVSALINKQSVLLQPDENGALSMVLDPQSTLSIQY